MATSKVVASLDGLVWEKKFKLNDDDDDDDDDVDDDDDDKG
jgi:hypothetical protein